MTNTATYAAPSYAPTPPPPAPAPQEWTSRPVSAPVTLGCSLRLEHQEGPHGGTWAVRNESGEQIYSMARRPGRGSRTTVRDPVGEDRESLGERVLSLVEHYTVWHGGRPAARIYRPGGGTHRGRWFVEVGNNEGWVVLVDHAGMCVLSGGQPVARLGNRGPEGMPTSVEVTPGTDAALVLLLADLVYAHDRPSV